MASARRLRWYQQLRWRFPTTYLLLMVVPMVLLFGASLVLGYLRYEAVYTPETFLSLTAAKAPEAGALLASPPVNPAATRLLLEDLDEDLLTLPHHGRTYALAYFSEPSVAAALVDRDGLVLASAHQGGPSVGATVGGPGSALVAAALSGATATERLTVRAEDGSIFAAAPALDPSGRVVGALYARVHAPYSASAHVRSFLGILWGPVSTQLLLAMLFAAAFGVVAARGIIARFEHISEAAAQWGRGNFSVAIDDRSSDELGQLAGRLDRMARELHGVVELRQELAMVEERHRIARDLHDSVKQQMFALAMQIGAAQATLNGDHKDVAVRLAEAEKLSRSVQQELVAMIRELQPPSREGKPFGDVLREYVADWVRQSGIAAEVHTDRADHLPPAVEHAFFRVAQEALANVLRHSGASHVEVSLTHGEPGTAVFRVTDNGSGFDRSVPSHGLGLGDMRARIEELPGGRFSVTAADGGGTRIEAVSSTAEPQQRS